ncbi:pseudouridine synthase [Cytophagaceae bacterium ABcell3]|nr:pseudouridine synthase [Cytophagaceae bacterium ABcell3]
MNLTKKPARFFLVQKLSVSNKEAAHLIVQQRLLVNGQPAQVNQPIYETDEVTFDGQLLQEAKKCIYLACYKPCGIETTLNREIPDNLYCSFDIPEGVFPAGRLDKASEGLLLFTNDGALYQDIVHCKTLQEKQYLVTVNKPLTEEVLKRLSTGVKIMDKMTRPCLVKKMGDSEFQITLTEGRNRQIRRMCYKLGYEVVKLVRTRIINLQLGNLKPGEWRSVKKEDIYG